MPDSDQLLAPHNIQLPDVPVAAARPAVEEARCPRCKEQLIDPQGLGWCRVCGYCRSLEDERTKELLAKTKVEPPRPTMAMVAGHVPVWVWVLVGGMGVVLVAALVLDWALPPGKCLPRALCTSAQIGLGILVIFFTQLLVLMHVAADDEKLGFKDALVPTRLWMVAVRRLPRTAPYLWIASWGLALIVSALVFIGGLGHWYSYLPGVKTQQTTKKQ